MNNQQQHEQRGKTARTTVKKSRSPGKKKSGRRLGLLLVPLLCLIALIIGLNIGYVQLGGQDMADVWDLNTWKHLFDLVFAE